jgi:hypothetical protein
VDPVPDPQLLRKSDSAGNRTRISGSVGRNVPEPQRLRKSDSTGNRTRTSGSVGRNSDHRGGHIYIYIYQSCSWHYIKGSVQLHALTALLQQILLLGRPLSKRADLNVVQ